MGKEMAHTKKEDKTIKKESLKKVKRMSSIVTYEQ